ncbi:pyridoxal phosphate-dependent transferase [Amylostereum chailletii]|nr:pyridoxal phosphate-dependent transferase [Amylostereum chailletii]
MSALTAKLTAALASRDDRHIRRRLPAPSSPSAPTLTDFSANDYLSLASSAHLRAQLLAALSSAPDILGSGGSRLLVNGAAHAALEARLERFFRAPAALLFNSGFDANAGFFASVPQPSDALVLDAHVHASVHDGARASRVPKALQRPFAHNDVAALQRVLRALAQPERGFAEGDRSVFVAVESVYSMDGTIAPLEAIVRVLEETFPAGNGYLVVDEAHATGVYGPQGRGLVAMLGLEDKVLARLHTFGKALAATGAVVLTTPLVRDYLLNYARPLIYTTSLSHANIVAANCSFDLLENGTASALSARLLANASHFLHLLRTELASVPADLLSLPPHLRSPHSTTPTPDRPTALPTAIIPLLTRFPRPLSAFLAARGMNARPITWPTVPKGEDRVRVCLQANTTRAELENLVGAAVEWARGMVAEREEERRRRERKELFVGVLISDYARPTRQMSAHIQNG